MKTIKHICIVGGGTAGWITALILRGILEKPWLTQPEFEYTVVESPDVPIIGVGEGSTGLLVDVIKNYPNFGCNEKDFIRETGATIKVGIRHRNWAGDTEYFGPLDILPVDNLHPNNINYNVAVAISKGQLAQEAYLNTKLFRENKTPFVNQHGVLKDVTPGYSYHFDAFKVGQYFRKVATGLGVKHIPATVQAVGQDEQGYITNLTLDTGNVKADFFIDCSGFSKLLIKKVYNDPFKSYSKYNLVNAAQMFRREHDGDPFNYTQAHAQDAGWIFSIPVQERIGNGYIYSRDFISLEQVQDTIMKLYPNAVLLKQLNFDSGRHEHAWIKNMCAIGLSYAFGEPLEATSIHCTIVQGMLLADYISRSMNFEPAVIENYNSKVRKVYDDCAEFINMHYKGPNRHTEFWKAASSAETSFPKTQERLELWTHKYPDNDDFHITYGSFGTGLYMPVLSGIGFLKPEQGQRVLDHFLINQQAEGRFVELQARQEQVADLCLSHREFLDWCNQ